MISVCIATYNGEEYIKQQLESILVQLSEDDEVIISDDGSTDATLDIINSLNDKRIEVINHTSIKTKFKIDNITHNFENALNNSHGDYIFLSDQDDVWLPGKVEMVMNKLRDYYLVVTDCDVVDDKLNIINKSYFDLRPFSNSIFHNIYKSSFLGSCMAFRRDVLIRAIPFPKYGVAHDLWLGLVALKFFDVKVLDIPFMLYRRHENTVTDSGKTNTNSLFYKLSYRAYIVSELIKRLFVRY